MTLRVLKGGCDEAVEAYAPGPFNLRVQPLRPGMAHERVEVVLDEKGASAVEAASTAEGVPTDLWAAIAIESERALLAAAEATGFARERLEAALDTASGDPKPGIPAQRGRRLGAYARALRRRNAATQGGPARRLPVAVAYHTLVAWELEAARAGASVATWASGLLAAMPEGRLVWEAAAAEAGQTLGEWIAVQAARRDSC